jgi:hypothetical protein
MKISVLYHTLCLIAGIPVVFRPAHIRVPNSGETISGQLHEYEKDKFIVAFMSACNRWNDRM